MNDVKKKSKPVGTIVALLLLILFLSPFGNTLMREAFLSFKNGNIVGQSAPETLDGVKLVPLARADAPSAEAGQSWTLYTFFSPT